MNSNPTCCRNGWRGTWLFIAAVAIGFVASCLVAGCNYQNSASSPGNSSTASGKTASGDASKSGATSGKEDSKTVSKNANKSGGENATKNGDNAAGEGNGETASGNNGEKDGVTQTEDNSAANDGNGTKNGDETTSGGGENTNGGNDATNDQGSSTSSGASNADAVDKLANPVLEPGDWNQWLGSRFRNNVPVATNIPTEWDVGAFDRKTGAWEPETAHNIKWVAALGSQSYGNPVIADGRVYAGTNNGNGYLARYPYDVDLGCLLCFREADGKLLWQHSSEKLPTGRVHDWELQGICATPLVEGKRLWFVSSRGKVICLDTEGYYDNEDDGPVTAERARIFLADLTLHAGLDDGLVSDGLRAAFATAGVELDAVSVETVTEGQEWTLITGQFDDEAPRYNIKLADGQVVVTAPAAAEGEEPREIIRTDDRLTTGLEEGKLHPILVALYQRSGETLAESPRVEQVTPGRKWSMKSEVNGIEREFTIEIAGPRITSFKVVTTDDKLEADTVWELDMMRELGVSQHNMCSCSVTSLGDILFVITGNGVDESHANIPAPDAPSFLALDKNTGEVFWTDNSPGLNILHGQWSSPTVAELGGVPQALFAGGDGWLYSFRADRGKDGKPEFLWKFDANPKTSKYSLSGSATRNILVGTPVVYDGLVYIAVGEDPEHGEGNGHLWCINPNRRGDVSAELAVRVEDRTTIIPHKRIQAVIEENGEIAIDNPNSAVIWHYEGFDENGDGRLSFEETMHRTIGSTAIKDDILYITDFSGLLHCLDAKTGKSYWTYDMLAQSWGSPLIVDGKVYVGDQNGDIAIFPLSREQHDPINEVWVGSAVYTTPVVANGTLFIANQSYLFAIANPDEPVAGK